MPPVTEALKPVSSFLGPIGQVASVIGTVQGLTQKAPKISSAPVPVPAVETPFAPKKPAPIARPLGLDVAGYDPTQERSALATKGVNVGLGGDEESYYRNLVSRSLIGDDNRVTGTPESLLPVESQYFAGRGMDTSNINNLLKAIMGG